MSERYSDRPFLRLIECLALDAIDALDADQRATLEQMTPELAKTFELEGTWQEIVAGQMQWGPAIGDAIREVWARNTQVAREMGTTLTPEEFAMLFADANTVDGGEDA